MSREVDNSVFVRYTHWNALARQVVDREGITRRRPGGCNPACPLLSLMASDKRSVDHLNFLVERVTLSLSRDGPMAEVALKHTVPAQSATVRERLHSMDDAGVVGAFLGGEERFRSSSNDTRLVS